MAANVVLAKWSDRFFAWLIDFLIVSAASTLLIFASFGTLDFEFEGFGFWAESSQYIPTSVIFFAYWSVLEFKTGQTVGKKILNLRVTDMKGNKPKITGVLIGCFGKAFILPIDVILGWIFTNEKRQRIFNRIGNTVVVKIKENEDGSDVTFIKD